MSGTETRSGAGTVITIVLAAVGAVVLVGAAAGAAVAGTVRMSQGGSGGGEGNFTAEVDGVSSVQVDVDAADVTVQFGAVDVAELSTTGLEADRWTLRTDGDTLVVSSPDRNGPWFGGWWWNDETAAILTLPESLRGSDASLILDAGSLDAEGDFGVVSVEVNAGSASVDGSADELEVSVSAGDAEVSLDGVRRASYELSAGWVDAELGSVPDDVTVNVSAGTLTLTVPDAAYRLTRDVSAGSLNSDLREGLQADGSVDVVVSAGSVDLRVGN